MTTAARAIFFITDAEYAEYAEYAHLMRIDAHQQKLGHGQP